MMKHKLLAVAVLLLVLAFTAGCGSSSFVREANLSPEAVVQKFFTAAQNNRMNEAAAYVSPTAAGDTQTVFRFVTGQSGTAIKNANLLSVRLIAQQNNFAIALATLQPEQNSLNLDVKPVGLEKIDGEWYLVDYDQVFREAKYQLLAQLFKAL